MGSKRGSKITHFLTHFLAKKWAKKWPKTGFQLLVLTSMIFFVCTFWPKSVKFWTSPKIPKNPGFWPLFWSFFRSKKRAETSKIVQCLGFQSGLKRGQKGVILTPFWALFWKGFLPFFIKVSKREGYFT